MDGTLTLPDGRTAGWADYGEPDGTAVLWCHGGPGSRLEPSALAAQMPELRFVGIDRPGYGHSTAVPGRTIAQWVPDALGVLDHLGIERFVALGVSTGGAYALALAAASPRVLGVVACCALTDMRWEEGKASMRGNPGDLWGAADRAQALAIAEEFFGADGTKLLSQANSGGAELPAADLALLSDPEWLGGFLQGVPAMFAQGVIGYADDRLADGPGWGSFDVSRIGCPVVVLHGSADSICPVAHAHHTAKLVPDATLSVHDGLGHFSILTAVPDALREVLRRATL